MTNISAPSKVSAPSNAFARHCMQTALSLARRGLGAVAPNPSVGCVLWHSTGDGGTVVGRGWTGVGGRPHAETEALRRAGSLARGARATVTLEPCAHEGVTPPCAKKLIEAGIVHVDYAIKDPDSRVAGRGAALLKSAGVSVSEGLLKKQAQYLNAGFFSCLEKKRPLVTLKMASTMDGRIATRTGSSRWITSRQARLRVHILRATHDAVLVGSATVLADDPKLNCRVVGLTQRPMVAIVADSRMRVPLNARLVEGASRHPFWLLTQQNLSSAQIIKREKLHNRGVVVETLPCDSSGHINLSAALTLLSKKGITRLLVEGGGVLAASFIKQNLVDRVIWFTGPMVLGNDGLPAIGDLGYESLPDGNQWKITQVAPCDNSWYVVMEKSTVKPVM